VLGVIVICSSKERAASAESVQSQVKTGYQVVIFAIWVQLNRGKSRHKSRPYREVLSGLANCVGRMTHFFQSLHPVVQALVATCFTWAMTAFGAAAVFTARD